jgi:chaperonin GroEL
MLEGVLPGGGVSLLACRTALQGKLNESSNPDERAAFNILIKAVEAPFRAIMSNSGYEPSEVLARIRLHPNEGCGFDVRSGQVVNMVEAGIFDSAKAQKMATQSAITSAALALTTEVLVQHKNPKPPAEQGPGNNWYKSSKPNS